MQEMNTLHPGPWLFEEDFDPSYGMRKEGLAREFKSTHNITNHEHPAHSPDLNSIEACWNIVKQPLRRKRFYTDEVKEALREEWSKITLEELRKRKPMRKRCKSVREHGGKPVNGALW